MNGGQCDGVHCDMSLANDHAKEFHFGSIEEAFGDFQRKTMFTEVEEYTLDAFVVEG